MPNPSRWRRPGGKRLKICRYGVSKTICRPRRLRGVWRRKQIFSCTGIARRARFRLAAIRIGLATGVPVLASPTTWFHDLRDVTHQPADMMEGVRRLLDDTELRTKLTTAAESYCRENSWSKVA